MESTESMSSQSSFFLVASVIICDVSHLAEPYNWNMWYYVLIDYGVITVESGCLGAIKWSNHIIGIKSYNLARKTVLYDDLV